MTGDELQAETMNRAAAKVAELTETLQAELKNVEPLTREQIDEMAKHLHETDPEFIRQDAEIRQLNAINAIFEKGDKKK